jgi:hypothetical protein
MSEFYFKKEIEASAMQFPTVTGVRVFVDGKKFD